MLWPLFPYSLATCFERTNWETSYAILHYIIACKIWNYTGWAFFLEAQMFMFYTPLNNVRSKTAWIDHSFSELYQDCKIYAMSRQGIILLPWRRDRMCIFLLQVPQTAYRAHKYSSSSFPDKIVPAAMNRLENCTAGPDEDVSISIITDFKFSKL